MKVVLVKDVAGLGTAGEIKDVKKGFAFNYLLPEGLAELATAGIVKSVERSLAKRNAEKSARVSELSASMKRIDGMTLTVKVKAAEGKLFGSVNAADIVAAAKSNDIEIVEEMVQLEHPIKAVGEYAVKLEAGQSKAIVTVSVVAE
ncbi:MAG: 50S ribosomal protein L9 [Candidatus Moraniibacteriota bacterium]|nr:MAG: 50S ribosomal protein L9 [Candidatus Moranbacteria bacterium]